MADEKMFCFQCEQTAGGSACTMAGVCGKSPETALLQDELTGALIALAQATGDAPLSAENTALLFEGMFACVSNVSFSDAAIRELAAQVRDAAAALDASARDFDMRALWQADEDLRSLKSLLLFGMRGVAAYAWHAHVLGKEDPAIAAFMCEGLAAIAGTDDADALLSLDLKCGEVNITAMALLESANLEAFGTPGPATLELEVEPGPFIVVTGHDLHDLERLLEQTKDKGVNVYTHGEMLPAHAYPKLRAYSHLKGNFGTAWHNQKKEFAELPAPILWTTNCLLKPDASYADRVFTTGPVSFPGAPHIGDDKDFTPIIERALELGGWPEKRSFTGINGGHKVSTGFGYDTVMGVAPAVIDAVKSGDISRFLLVAGCDGMKAERSYYTELVKSAPADSVVLTLACGKFRFNDLDLGEIGGIPRLLDVGQCNDAYGAVKIALALAEAFECGVNDLPLSFVLSWYEQKAVCILLSLLHLGIKGIYLGPSLPAFVSPNILNALVEKFGIRPTSTPEHDLAEIFA